MCAVESHSFSHRTKANGHPYGFAWGNQDSQIAFLRISKAGSTFFVKQLNLRSIKQHIGDYPEEFFVFTVIRDPVARLLSSIPETLKRVRANPGAGQIKCTRDIEASITQFRGSDFVELAIHTLGLIRENGAFDAHHEQQFKFIFDFDGVPYHNVAVFDLERARDALSAITNHAGLGSPYPKIVRRELFSNSRSKKNKVNNYPIQFPSNHPLPRILGKSAASLTNREVEAGLRRGYAEIRNNRRAISLAQEIVHERYQTDVLLYTTLKARLKKGNGIVRLADLFHV